jgi:hypothetical protein
MCPPQPTCGDAVPPETQRGIPPLFSVHWKTRPAPIGDQIETDRFKIRPFSDKVPLKRVPAARLIQFDPAPRAFIKTLADRQPVARDTRDGRIRATGHDNA